MLEMIVRETVYELNEKLAEATELHELYKQREKFSPTEFIMLEEALIQRLEKMKQEFFKEGFKQGIQFASAIHL
ncbi:hypothetical protein D3C84_953320 [compost metagenome]